MNNPTKKPNPSKRLAEGKPEFDENKMRKLLKQDKFLNFFYQDKFARGSAGEQSIGLEAMYQTFIVDKAHGNTHAKLYQSVHEIDILYKNIF